MSAYLTCPSQATAGFCSGKLNPYQYPRSSRGLWSDIFVLFSSGNLFFSTVFEILWGLFATFAIPYSIWVLFSFLTRNSGAFLVRLDESSWQILHLRKHRASWQFCCFVGSFFFFFQCSIYANLFDSTWKIVFISVILALALVAMALFSYLVDIYGVQTDSWSP